jgi:quercetin dioxygenase-like cupin family protein
MALTRECEQRDPDLGRRVVVRRFKEAVMFARFDLKDAVKDNDFYRKVLFTGKNSQLVAMSLAPGEEIGSETHSVDQLIYIVKGEGLSVIDGDEAEFEEGDAICIPAGAVHNVINANDKRMKLFTVYSPPQHEPNLVQESKPVEASEMVSTR